MDIENREFIDRVRVLYVADPGYISSIPFWKLEGMLARSRTCEAVDGSNSCLYAVEGDRLIFYWSDNTENFMLPPEQVSRLSFLVLHEDFYRLLRPEMVGEYEVTPSYTLFYDPARETAVQSNLSYCIDDFDFSRDQEFDNLARLVRDTDPHYRLTGERVHDWVKSPAYAPTLWFWARDRATGTRVGVAVSNYNPRMQETDLDWFYVLPAHQGKGIGRMLVRETIDRSRERSMVIRLGGVADGFYVKCGFRRRDKWFIVRRCLPGASPSPSGNTALDSRVDYS